MQKITTFLMFEGDAEAAMNFYTSLFEDSEIVDITRYGPDDAGPEGTVQVATFALNGQQFMCIDSHVQHEFTFTPAISLFVHCQSEAEVDQLFEALSDGGQIFMPLGTYPFSQKYGWVADRFGVSWQIGFAGDQ